MLFTILAASVAVMAVCAATLTIILVWRVVKGFLTDFNRW